MPNMIDGIIINADFGKVGEPLVQVWKDGCIVTDEKVIRQMSFDSMLKYLNRFPIKYAWVKPMPKKIVAFINRLRKISCRK